MAEETKTESLLDGEGTTTPPASDDTTSLLDSGAADGTQTEAKSDAEKKPDASSTSTEQKPDTTKSGAPEKYADFTLPDGISLDAEFSEKFKTTAKELNLTQEGAQKFVNLAIDQAKGQHEKMMQNYKKQVEGFKQETVKSLGADYKKELAHAHKAMEQFGSPELKDLLKAIGYADHKEVVNLLIKVGKAISNDTLVTGGNPSASKSIGEIFYGNK